MKPTSRSSPSTRVIPPHLDYASFRVAVKNLTLSKPNDRDERLGILVMESDKLDDKLTEKADDVTSMNQFTKELTRVYENIKLLKVD